MILEDQQKNQLAEQKDKQARLKQNRPSSAEMRRQQAEIKLLENKLEKAQTQYNSL